ncbi:microsomal triglyceride transfer protein large subunit [Scaptodrosophila lebanonensis]|uniref:Microsomal triglyceride transfer protein large subunit n=1 Tax=Drosophila lebanonensis TaxID=7225 RepID=A0A6J2U2Q1_DROLE|nr:microsomal triglyceride transfer protein large subunit [Scaptodrosophila lebanonensis]
MKCRQLLLLFALFSRWCLSTTTAATNTFLIPTGSEQIYELRSKVSLRELKHQQIVDESTSYSLQTQLRISSVWSSADQYAQLLKVAFVESQVSAPGKAEDRPVDRTVSSLSARPFYISVVKGQPQHVIAHTSRDQSLLNLERGIASLLQLRYVDATLVQHEVDVSGRCRVQYNVKSSTRLEKLKTDCANWDLRVNYRSEHALGVVQQSQEQINYELSADGVLLRAESLETHLLSLSAKPDVGSSVQATLTLQNFGEGGDEVKQFEQSTLEAAIESLLDWYRVFELEADVDGVISELKQQTFTDRLKKATKQLQSTDVGKSSLALSFVQLLPYARLAKQKEFKELLKHHEDILPQLVDLLGAVQSFEAHNATFAHFYDGAGTNTESLDLLERYLQSLAVATHPERPIIEHLYALLNSELSSKQLKLRDSILQTLATLTRQSGFEPNDALLQKVRTHILNGLSSGECGGRVEQSDCQTLYIRALQNLQDVETIDVLLEQSQSLEAKVSVAALQALKAFPARTYSEKHRQQFSAIFYQQRRRFDSSARTLALDILLAMRPNPSQLGELLDYLASNDRQFEIKTYVLQKLRMLAEQCPRFRALYQSALSTRAKVNNYHVLGQKGLTTVLTRQLSQSPAFNESFLSTQEVYQGILKRGSVEFLLHAGRAESSSFKLGIYTAALGALVGDGDADQNDDIPADDELGGEETVTAGMEISVQGAQLRPLIFFNGQAELMGHVWGGSASDSTPAYQATTLVQDHEQYIILASGASLHWRLLGARSVDLNGKVGFSLWNRNAQTEIQQNTGSAVWGHIAVGFTYAKLVQDFTLTHEPKLSLQADLDFYSSIKLCMQLQCPEQLLTYANSKSVYLQNVERAYTKNLRSTQAFKSAGRTFALNQKNNEMCNSILDN